MLSYKYQQYILKEWYVYLQILWSIYSMTGSYQVLPFAKASMGAWVAGHLLWTSMQGFLNTLLAMANFVFADSKWETNYNNSMVVFTCAFHTMLL